MPTLLLPPTKRFPGAATRPKVHSLRGACFEARHLDEASVQQLLIHLEQAGFDGAPRFLGTEPDGSIVLSWIDGWVPADTECWRLDHKELASVGELLRSYHDCVAGFTPRTGFEEGPQAVGAG